MAVFKTHCDVYKIKEEKMTKVMNNSIFRSTMRINMIVLYTHQHETNCMLYRAGGKGKTWFVNGLTD